MLSILDDVDHWRARACEHRALAGRFRDPEAKRLLLTIATAFEEMGHHAEKRVMGKGLCEAVRADRSLRWASYQERDD
jgi:hypothetical protein